MAVSSEVRQKLRKRLTRSTLRKLPSLTPLLIGAGLGATMNRRDTRRLADQVRADLAQRIPPDPDYWTAAAPAQGDRLTVRRLWPGQAPSIRSSSSRASTVRELSGPNTARRRRGRWRPADVGRGVLPQPEEGPGGGQLHGPGLRAAALLVPAAAQLVGEPRRGEGVLVAALEVEAPAEAQPQDQRDLVVLVVRGDGLAGHRLRLRVEAERGEGVELTAAGVEPQELHLRLRLRVRLRLDLTLRQVGDRRALRLGLGEAVEHRQHLGPVRTQLEGQHVLGPDQLRDQRPHLVEDAEGLGVAALGAGRQRDDLQRQRPEDEVLRLDPRCLRQSAGLRLGLGVTARVVEGGGVRQGVGHDPVSLASVDPEGVPKGVWSRAYEDRTRLFAERNRIRRNRGATVTRVRGTRVEGAS
ncbi:hypothetical protein GCM10020229_55110 [Kitasatospora albolonga]|uniref:hypothetical protein n=1 Tax=Kitasatospora albolonga TaxID=68173 RepID=UPI0031EDDD88